MAVVLQVIWAHGADCLQALYIYLRNDFMTPDISDVQTVMCFFNLTFVLPQDKIVQIYTFEYCMSLALMVEQ